METIVLKSLYHRDQECIGIYFERNAVLQSLIQKQVGGRWSKTQKCWYVLSSKNNYQQLSRILEGKAELQNDELKKYLLEKKKCTHFSTIQNKPNPSGTREKNQAKNTVPIQQLNILWVRNP